MDKHTDRPLDEGKAPSSRPQGDEHNSTEGPDSSAKSYLRFAAMILTSMVVMYFVMFASVWEWTHIRFSESRVFMAVTMGGTMGLVMLAWMLGMYKNTKGNIAVVAGSVLLIGGGITLDRSQASVDDVDFMTAMIPHHSMAITRSERFQNEDIRVCELAVEISEAQRREIDEMDWLVRDIQSNGPVTTTEEAAGRQVPDFSQSAARSCGTD